MCGIFGYTGSKAPTKVCLDGLKLLEYRGYDSSGIAGVHENSIFFRKEKGKVHNLELAINPLSLLLRNAIAHTRWATHGRPSEENAHPQLDENENIAVVHNGIIENYFSLKQMLMEKGVIFSSETDTEVIAQLMGFYYKGDVLEAFQKTLACLKGFWAIALIHKDHPETILASCKENPLVIGVNAKDKEVYLSSDVNAFYTPDLDVLFLQNEEIAFLSPEGVQVFDINSQLISKTLTRMSLEKKQISKNGFPHFMLKEIFEQPDVIRQTLHGRLIEDLGTATFSELSLTDQELLSVKQILILGCGTSWHAGLIAANWIEEKVRIPAKAEIASEFRYRDPVLAEGTLVLAISQSGETFDTIAAVRDVKSKGAKVLAICNVPNSTLTREADSCLFLRAGLEISVCSTKAFTGQLTVLSLFTLLMGRLKGMSLEEGKKALQNFTSLSAKADLVLRKKEEIHELAKKYAKFNNFFFLGRNYMYASSLEAALKLKEISYINAMGYPAGEMKHGPIALVDSNLPVIGFCGHEKTLDKMLSNLMEVKARGAPVLAFAPIGAKQIETVADDILWLPSVSDDLNCFLYSIASQLLAYFIALERGTDIDQPRNLAKSVTVE
ncbi:MAG: glutamine--fructose-6-phosphate transaminase (isomerizing) [Verrucomicrobia bacterium]|nr:glutamine--fructose-6-phosphate transaminase (isomerizing) [Verrucomicrobiota bacterium]